MGCKKYINWVIFVVLVALPVAAYAGQWGPPTEWTYSAGYGRVRAAADKLPKTMPLKIISAKSKGKQMVFESDWGLMDIPKETTLQFVPTGKQTTVKVTGAPSVQAYRILRGIGDNLNQPLPKPPRRFKY